MLFEWSPLRYYGPQSSWLGEAGMRVGFIGLGKMGRPMTLRLLEAGHQVTVHSRSRGPVEEMVGRGARAASSTREVSEHAEVVLAALPTV